MSRIKPLLLVLFIIYGTSQGRTTVQKTGKAKECRINLPLQVHKSKSLLVIDESSSNDLIYPNANDPTNLVIKSGKNIGIFCPSEYNSKSHKITKEGSIVHGSDTLDSHVSLVCQSDSTFEFDDAKVRFDDFDCKEEHGAILREAKPSKTVCQNGKLYEIGYYLNEETFIRTIELCHDEELADTLWAHAIIQPSNSETTRYKGKRIEFKTGIMFQGMHMMDTYKLKNVYETLSELLGDKTDKYLSPSQNDNKFLAKGHLIARADMIYKSEQDGTMFFGNVIPMWQQINGNPGNWFVIEEYTRDFANYIARPLEVWVGGIGILKLEKKEIYLHQDKVPVHSVLFKTVVDVHSKQAIVFVVVNNPYATLKEVENKKGEYRVCDKINVCDNIFKHWNDPKRGYLYCCEVKSFYKNNKEELGLEELKQFVEFKKLDLVAYEKISSPKKESKIDRLTDDLDELSLED